MWQTVWVNKGSEAKKKSEGNLKFEEHIPDLIFDEELILMFCIPLARGK